MNDDHRNNNNDDRRNVNAVDEKSTLRLAPPRRLTTDDNDDMDASSFSSEATSTRPGAEHVPGVHRRQRSADEDRTEEEVSSSSSLTQQSQQQQEQEPEILVEARVVSERGLALQYCEDRLREIELREAQLEREQRQLRNSATLANLPVVMAQSVIPINDDGDDDNNKNNNQLENRQSSRLLGRNSTTTSTNFPASPSTTIQRVTQRRDISATLPVAQCSANAVATGQQQQKQPDSSNPGHRKNQSSGGGSVLARVVQSIIPAGAGRVGRRKSVPCPPKKAKGVKNVVWCWKETPVQMTKHSADQVVGNPADCWIRYSPEVHSELEAALESVTTDQTNFRPKNLPGYKIDFVTMHQTRLPTNFAREIQRVVVLENRPTICQNNAGSDDDDKSTGDGRPHMIQVSHAPSIIPTIAKVETGAIVWCWKETPGPRMSKHPPDVVFSVEHCWIRYPPEASRILERAYQERRKDCVPLKGYVVTLFDNKNVGRMKQTKTATGYQRDVLRFEPQKCGEGNDDENNNGSGLS